MIGQLNYPAALKTMCFGAFRSSDKFAILRYESWECPLHLSSFGFHPIQSGRGSKYLRHCQAYTSQLTYPYAQKKRLLSVVPCSDKPEF